MDIGNLRKLITNTKLLIVEHKEYLLENLENFSDDYLKKIEMVIIEQEGKLSEALDEFTDELTKIEKQEQKQFVAQYQKVHDEESDIADASLTNSLGKL